ncbi:MAG: DUF2461 domain-containing protein [Ferruginibacter sp.]
MLQATTLKFLKELKKNNNKIWFDEHRKEYDAAKSDFLLLVEQLIKGIAGFDKPIGNLEAKNCTFRINRDVRFSKNKDPYKSNIAAYFNKDGKKGIGSGYYLHIEPGKTFAAGGIWVPEPAVLAGIRQEIDYSFAEWKKIITDRSFVKIFTEGIKGEALTRPPKGYDENNPAIEYLKMKSFIVSHTFTDAEVQSKIFVKDVTKVFNSMKPLVDFLNTALH